MINGTNHLGWPHQPSMPEVICRFPATRRVVSLTFDDGPTPGVTEDVLRLLKRYDACATFFCLGRNVQRHRELFLRIASEGHGVGNHSHSHPDGWTVPHSQYLADVESGNATVNSRLFRPPYGKLTPPLYLALKRKYVIVNWDVCPEDFNPQVDGDYCLQQVKRNVGPGSIIVFHDSLPAASRMLPALQRSLEWLKAEGYAFASIEDQLIETGHPAFRGDSRPMFAE